MSVSADGTVGVDIDDLPYAMDIQNIRPMLSGEKIQYHLGQEQMKIKNRKFKQDTFAVIKHEAFIEQGLRDVLQERAIVTVERSNKSLDPSLTLISCDKAPSKYYAVYTAALRPAKERDEFLYHIHGCYALIEQDIIEEPEDDDI